MKKYLITLSTGVELLLLAYGPADALAKATPSIKDGEFIKSIESAQ